MPTRRGGRRLLRPGMWCSGVRFEVLGFMIGTGGSTGFRGGPRESPAWEKKPDAEIHRWRWPRPPPRESRRPGGPGCAGRRSAHSGTDLMAAPTMALGPGEGVGQQRILGRGLAGRQSQGHHQRVEGLAQSLALRDLRRRGGVMVAQASPAANGPSARTAGAARRSRGSAATSRSGGLE